MKCAECRFWAGQTFSPANDYYVADCRREAPVAPGLSVWPAVKGSDWCGEFRPRPAETAREGEE